MGPLTIDIGGTFTDAIYLDEATGEIRTGKSLTRSSSFVDSVLEAVDMIRVGPADVSYFAFGSTVAVNAIIQQTGARTAFVTTAGFRDILEIDRGNRPELHSGRYSKLRPLVPRSLCFEVRERIDANGRIVTDLNTRDIERIARCCRDEKVEAIAIQFLNSYVEPHHEARAAALFRKLCPDLAVTASHEISGEWGEYERASTTIFNAYLQPVVCSQLSAVESALKERGFACPLFALQSSGGTTTFSQATQQPITLLESGSSAGINGAAYIGEACGESKLLYVDIGGTTAKCSVIDGYQPKVTGQYWVSRPGEGPGYPIRMPVVDIVEIGVGGGSIGWIDDAGSLRVGLRSAGADPGPACYGRGGSEPTITDADLVANRIRADYFAGGRMTLHGDRAIASMGRLGTALGLPADQVAAAMLRVSDAAMINALRLVSVQRGHDPRDFVMIAAGGGGPLHAARLGQELGVREIIIPRYPGYASAFGMLVTQPRRDFARTLPRLTSSVDAGFLPNIFLELEQQARRYFSTLSELAIPDLTFEYLVDMRYAGQQHCLTLRLDGSKHQPGALAERFAEAHENGFTFRLEGHAVEFVTYRLTASAEARRTPLRPSSSNARSIEAALREERVVDFCEYGRQNVRVFARDSLPLTVELAGPALVEEPSSTTVVLPGQRLYVDQFGLLHIRPTTPEAS